MSLFYPCSTCYCSQIFSTLISLSPLTHWCIFYPVLTCPLCKVRCPPSPLFFFHVLQVIQIQPPWDFYIYDTYPTIYISWLGPYLHPRLNFSRHREMEILKFLQKSSPFPFFAILIRAGSWICKFLNLIRI